MVMETISNFISASWRSQSKWFEAATLHKNWGWHMPVNMYNPCTRRRALGFFKPLIWLKQFVNQTTFKIGCWIMNYGTDLYDILFYTFKVDCFVTLLCDENNGQLFSCGTHDVLGNPRGHDIQAVHPWTHPGLATGNLVCSLAGVGVGD